MQPGVFRGISYSLSISKSTEVKISSVNVVDSFANHLFSPACPGLASTKAILHKKGWGNTSLKSWSNWFVLLSHLCNLQSGTTDKSVAEWKHFGVCCVPLAAALPGCSRERSWDWTKESRCGGCIEATQEKYGRLQVAHKILSWFEPKPPGQCSVCI